MENELIQDMLTLGKSSYNSIDMAFEIGIDHWKVLNSVKYCIQAGLIKKENIQAIYNHDKLTSYFIDKNDLITVFDNIGKVIEREEKETINYMLKIDRVILRKFKAYAKTKGLSMRTILINYIKEKAQWN